MFDAAKRHFSFTSFRSLYVSNTSKMKESRRNSIRHLTPAWIALALLKPSSTLAQFGPFEPVSLGGPTSAPAQVPLHITVQPLPTEAPQTTTVVPHAATETPPNPTSTTFLPASVVSVQASYDLGETISITYNYNGTEAPEIFDRMAIFADGLHANNGDKETISLFWCQRQVVCQGPPLREGKVRFGASTVSPEHLVSWTWPIPSGTYRAFLLRGRQAPYQVLGEVSTSFEVVVNDHLDRVVPAIQAIEQDIRELIAQNETMGPKFVRLGFHDCTGGCDGCVDMTFADNAGLHIPIDALRPIVTNHESTDLGISRADIWAMAAHIGADVAQTRSEIKVDFAMEFIGRVNCESTGRLCLDFNGTVRECRDTLGPHVPLPDPDITTDELFHFFFEEFGLDVQETVALMGAHTLGSLNKTHSGYDAPNGWVRDNLLLDNDYYHELIGPIEDLVDLAPPWHRFRFDNSDIPGVPNKPAWRSLPPALDGDGIVEIFMLNADISLVRELTHENMLADGTVLCEFVQFFATQQNVSRCPQASRSLEFAAEYKLDNALWLQDFSRVYKKVLNHGYPYDPTLDCPGSICVYS